MTVDQPYETSSHNLRPTLSAVIGKLMIVCKKTADVDAATTTPVQIWVLRRLLEYLLEMRESNAD